MERGERVLLERGGKSPPEEEVRILLERGGKSPPGERGGESSWREGGRVLLEGAENPPGERVYHSLQLPQDPLSCSLGCRGFGQLPAPRLI